MGASLSLNADAPGWPATSGRGRVSQVPVLRSPRPEVEGHQVKTWKQDIAEIDALAAKLPA